VKDDWPPPYEYQGRPTAWARLSRNVGDPIHHRHPCPECYQYKLCTDVCTLEPDLEEEDGTPCGSHMVCAECDQIWTAVEDGIIADAMAEMDFSQQLELDLDLGA
jgi:hypothetical protein